MDRDSSRGQANALLFPHANPSHILDEASEGRAHAVGGEQLTPSPRRRPEKELPGTSRKHYTGFGTIWASTGAGRIVSIPVSSPHKSRRHHVIRVESQPES
jgi:hypothetical protein